MFSYSRTCPYTFIKKVHKTGMCVYCSSYKSEPPTQTSQTGWLSSCSHKPLVGVFFSREKNHPNRHFFRRLWGKRKVPVDFVLLVNSARNFVRFTPSNGTKKQNQRHPHLQGQSWSRSQLEVDHHGIPDAARFGYRGFGVCRGRPALPDHRGGHYRVAYI